MGLVLLGIGGAIVVIWACAHWAANNTEYRAPRWHQTAPSSAATRH